MKNLKELVPVGAVLSLVFAFGYGWVANIVTLCSQEPFQWTGMVLARMAGIFIPPLGAVLGFI